jgi:hypothetical protein
VADAHRAGATATLAADSPSAPPAAPPNCRPLREKVVVIDVRDSDFVGGHIKGAKNIGACMGRCSANFSLQVAAPPVCPRSTAALPGTHPAETPARFLLLGSFGDLQR